MRCHASQNLQWLDTRNRGRGVERSWPLAALSCRAAKHLAGLGASPACQTSPGRICSDGWSESQGFSPATSINIRWHRPYDFEQQITTYRVMLSSAGDANFDTPRAFSYGYNRAASMSRVLPSYRCTTRSRASIPASAASSQQPTTACASLRQTSRATRPTRSHHVYHRSARAARPANSDSAGSAAASESDHMDVDPMGAALGAQSRGTGFAAAPMTANTARARTDGL